DGAGKRFHSLFLGHSISMVTTNNFAHTCIVESFRVKIKTSIDACFRPFMEVGVSSKVSLSKLSQRRLTMASTNGMIDPDDVVMLLIDHQSGLFNTVQDLP